MMTFIDYLIETSNLMSTDALKLAGSKFDKLALGKRDGSKPSEKRADQIHHRDKRRRGRTEEEEEPSEPARKDRTKRVMDQHRRQDDKERPSLKRQTQRNKRTARSYFGVVK